MKVAVPNKGESYIETNSRAETATRITLTFRSLPSRAGHWLSQCLLYRHEFQDRSVAVLWEPLNSLDAGQRYTEEIESVSGSYHLSRGPSTPGKI